MFTTHTSKTLPGCLMLLASLAFAMPALAMNDPVTGRWTTRDPLSYNPSKGRNVVSRPGTYIDGMNLYEFIKSSPQNGADPSGRYIIALGGAGGWGDAGFKANLRVLAQAERRAYKDQGCTWLFQGEQGQGFRFIKAPTGFSGALFPDWNRARRELKKELDWYNFKRDVVMKNASGCRDKCPEYLHVIGFSDGASTIADWLNAGAPGLKHKAGVLGLIDLVRKPRVPFDLNGTAGAPYSVDRANALYHGSLSNKSYGFLTAGWTGYEITGWSHDHHDGGVAHENFAGDPKVLQWFEHAFYIATQKLAEGCTCSQ